MSTEYSFETIDGTGNHLNVSYDKSVGTTALTVTSGGASSSCVLTALAISDLQRFLGLTSSTPPSSFYLDRK